MYTLGPTNIRTLSITSQTIASNHISHTNMPFVIMHNIHISPFPQYILYLLGVRQRTIYALYINTYYCETSTN